jgi:hypothetical protein
MVVGGAGMGIRAVGIDGGHVTRFESPRHAPQMFLSALAMPAQQFIARGNLGRQPGATDHAVAAVFG